MSRLAARARSDRAARDLLGGFLGYMFCTHKKTREARCIGRFFFFFFLKLEKRREKNEPTCARRRSALVRVPQIAVDVADLTERDAAALRRRGGGIAEVLGSDALRGLAGTLRGQRDLLLFRLLLLLDLRLHNGLDLLLHRLLRDFRHGS